MASRCWPGSHGCPCEERIRTLYLTVTALVCLALLTPASSTSAQRAGPGPESAHQHYTIQIQSSLAQRADVVREKCQKLQERGYIAYCQEAVVDNQRRIRLRLGAFATRSAAQAYAQDFARREGCDTLVVRGNVYVDSYGAAFDIVTTPAGIWLQTPAQTKRLYRFDSAGPVGEYSPARISPTGQAAAFYANGKIIKLDLTDNSISILRDDRGQEALFDVALRWSPNGRYLAYLDRVGWEQPTGLWVVREDGRDHRCLIDDETGATKVKSFQWHPSKSLLFYVAGPTHGTVSVGGALCRVELTGRPRVLVPADPDEAREVAGDFCIVDDQLFYRLAHFDEIGRVDRYTEHTLPVMPTDRR